MIVKLATSTNHDLLVPMRAPRGTRFFLDLLRGEVLRKDLTTSPLIGLLRTTQTSPDSCTYFKSVRQGSFSFLDTSPTVVIDVGMHKLARVSVSEDSSEKFSLIERELFPPNVWKKEYEFTVVRRTK